MRISTYQYYENTKAYIDKAQSDMNNALTEISSGKKSQDPVQMAQSEITMVRLSRIAQNIRNQGWLETSLNHQEAALNSSINALQSLKELSVQSNNSSIVNQKEIAIQAISLWEETKNYLNTQDQNKNYIFAGFSGNNPPFDNNGNYVAQGYSRSIEISQGINMKWSLDASDFSSNTLNTLKSQIDDFSNGITNNLNIAQPTIDTMLNELNLARTKIGVTASSSDNWLNNNKEKELNLQKSYANLTEVDTAKAISDFQKAQATYEATLKMVSIMTKSNLFDYI